MNTAEIIASLAENLPDLVEELAQSPAYTKVVDAFIRSNPESAQARAHELAWILALLRFFDRGQVVNGLLYHDDWKFRHEHAAELIREAAAMLDPTKVRSPSHRVMLLAEPVPQERRDVSKPENVGELAKRNQLHTALYDIADAVAQADAVLHAAKLPDLPALLDPSNISSRGGAAGNVQGAKRGLVVRELQQRLPDELRDDYAVIAELARLGNLEISRQNVRSILLRGTT